MCCEHCTGCPLAKRHHYGTRRCRGAGSSVLICCTKDVVSLIVCTPFVFACILLNSVCAPLVLRLYPVCTARDVSTQRFLYSLCIPLYSCVLHVYPFVLSPRLANIILLGDGRNTKVQKRANVLRALYWVPVGQTGSLRHAPLPRRRLLCMH